jgi:hypothetical protein
MQVVSAVSKKRILIKALQGLKQSKDGMHVRALGGMEPTCLGNWPMSPLSHAPCMHACMQMLTEHLKALQVASQHWQRSMMFASKR